MNLEEVSAQDLAKELVRRAKTGWAEKINAGFVALSVIDTFRTAGESDINDFREDAFEFVENVIDFMMNELAKTDRTHPLIDIRSISAWSSLTYPAEAPE